jgi:hypothetical protein
MRKNLKQLVGVLAVAGAFLTHSGAAQAWGNEGHRAVGAIAEKLLKGSNAEKRIAALLLPGETLESITNWADSAKGGAGYAPATPEQAAYTAINPRHNEYHYANVPFQLEHYHDGVVGGSDVDIVQTLKQAIAVLQGKTDPANNPRNFTPRQALLLIAHMVGDIHQPLHMGAAYISADGKFAVPARKAEIDAINLFDTRGGNNLVLDEGRLEELGKIIPGDPRALAPGEKKWPTKPFHAYWASTVVDYAMRRSSTRTPADFAQKMIDSKPDVKLASGPASSWPYQWADDALVAAKQAHTDVTVGKRDSRISSKGETVYTFALEMGPNYPVPSSALARTQLVKGGYHLAQLLQSIWP